MKFSEVLSLNGKKCVCGRIHSAAYATVPRHTARIDNIVNNYDKIITDKEKYGIISFCT